MKPNGEVRFRADSVNLLNLFLRYWKLLAISAIAVFIISAALSFTITPLYRSTVVLYPTTNVVETQTLFGVQTNTTPLFGDESATEKVLQVLKSDEIKTYLVSKYDLMNHYGISNKAKYKYTMLEIRMQKYIVARKTQYNSVEISVLDRDPVLAATIANDIARQVDTVFNKIVMDAGKKGLAAISNSYADQLRRVKSLEDSLHIIKGSNTLSAIPASLKTGSENSAWAEVAGKYSPEFLRLVNMFESENQNLSVIRSRLTEARMLAEQTLPYTHIINKAYVSEKKALPKRSVIVISATLSTLLLIFFVLAVSEMFVRDENQSAVSEQ
jgi:uncharacterized protein involved in exopolysaccharide biosynthesis